MFINSEIAEKIIEDQKKADESANEMNDAEVRAKLIELLADN